MSETVSKGGRSFCDLLGDAVKDEASAAEFYENLKKTVDEKGLPPEQMEAVKGLIDVVSKQEGKHRELFVAMKEKFCPGGVETGPGFIGSAASEEWKHRG